jgi:GNAT superfamily N-acetyltransferase
VTVHERLRERRNSNVPPTLSGARIEPIRFSAARTFLQRLDGNAWNIPTTGAAWGAFEHSEALIGVGVIATSRSSKARAFVVVAPERRRLGVGGELLQILVAHAQAMSLKTLACAHWADDPAPHQLVRSLALTAARRVRDKTTVMVLIVPHPSTDDPRGEL